ncbi:DsbA family protein [Methyloligella sp. 2.7D]|uniref:DsbA family protein n=1 Tax=unclassified Methyloligella TaxID=2625955 RepID=UPI00157C8B4A|nr:DsbA family protein [Methyloligella sp. GL2]QKP78310.1 DsbA family protein [Methyloligella sp. GL2]
MAQGSKSPKSQFQLILVAAIFIVALAAGGVFFLTSPGGNGVSEAQAATGEAGSTIPMEELMAKGPLPDVVIGDPDAPVTIVEYASMTCPHCADFHENVYPELKKEYVDTGKVKFIFREFPLDILAARASMLARCAGPDRQMALVSALFQTQRSWAVPGDEQKSMDGLLRIARQAGFSKESFDKCLNDQELYENIVKMRAKGSKEFGVNSTPSFFIDGKPLGREHQLENFEQVLGKADTGDTAESGSTE